jgi:hypothetical protein
MYLIDNKDMIQKLWKYGAVLSLWILGMGLALPVIVHAEPSQTNKIGLYIAAVRFAKDQLSEQFVLTSTNKYEYLAQPLGTEDVIRFRYSTDTLLDIKNVAAPSPTASYLKAYLNNDSSEASFITNVGNSPLPIKDLAPRLAAGRNTILLVLVDDPNGTATPATKVEITFLYNGPVTAPQPGIEVVSPVAGSILSKDAEKDFYLKLNNFTLEKESSGKPNTGKVTVYANEIKPENAIQTFTNSVATPNGYSELRFNTANGEKWATIPDNLKTKLVFVLQDSAGNMIGSPAELLMATNYTNTVDVGLPKITLLEPAANADINQNYFFRVKVDNFELLPSVKTTENKPTQGYLQIRVDDQLVAPNTDKTQFSLKDLNVLDKEGRVKVRIDIVNTQFEKIKPAAFVETTVTVKKIADNSEQAVAQNKQKNGVDNWRIAIIAATVVLILGSIAVLITRS